jgi:two-component system response regulator RegA
MPDPLKILVADDDSPYRSRLCQALRDRGHEVAEAGTCAEALDVVAPFGPDHAVLDLRLPDGTGLDLLTDLLAVHPDLRCIVLTGYGSIATAVEAVRQGAVDYLSKPADADEILRAFDPDAEGDPAESDAPSLHRVEWEHIQRVLADCDGNVSQAARVLGVHRRTLQRKLATRPPAR